MPHRSCRGGVKRRVRLLKYLFAHTPATAGSNDYFGTSPREAIDREYELLFAAHNPSVCKVDRREGYNPHKVWPFVLTLIDASHTAPAPADYDRPRDPRILGYAITWASSIFF
jgi:hypothetical protein